MLVYLYAMILLYNYVVTTALVGESPDDNIIHHHNRPHHHIHGHGHDHSHNNTHHHSHDNSNTNENQSGGHINLEQNQHTGINVNINHNKHNHRDDLPHCVDPSIRLQPCWNNDTYCGDWDIKNRKYIPNNCYYRDFTGEQARKCIGQ